jgi:hypothetical protein
MAKAACLREFDFASCAFLHLTIGVKIDMEALRHAVQDRQAAICRFHGMPGHDST